MRHLRIMEAQLTRLQRGTRTLSAMGAIDEVFWARFFFCLCSENLKFNLKIMICLAEEISTQDGIQTSTEDAYIQTSYIWRCDIYRDQHHCRKPSCAALGQQQSVSPGQHKKLIELWSKVTWSISATGSKTGNIKITLHVIIVFEDITKCKTMLSRRETKRDNM